VHVSRGRADDIANRLPRDGARDRDRRSTQAPLRAAVSDRDRSGRLLAGRFRLGRALGEGGMGTVHEAVDVSMDRPVALKLLRKELATDVHQLQRFEREARAAAKLSHPNVVGVTELVRDPALGLALVMERLAGRSLAARLDDGPLSEREAVDVAMQALDGLAAAHAAGMVHRDLKPSNVFLVSIARGVLVKLLDFGIVKLAEEGASPKLTRKGAMIGTPTYMSPEQVACAPVDARSDVYSMGACLYESLVARPPYEGAHSLAIIAAVGAGPPIDLLAIEPRVSPDLVHIVRVAMSRDPNGRYQTASAMREALRSAVIDDGPPRARPPRRAPRAHASIERTVLAAPTTDRTRPIAAIAIALALVIALGAAAWRSIDATPVPVPPRIAPPTAIEAPIVPTVSAPPVPHGIEPPETHAPPATSIARPRPSHPTPHRGRIGDDILDPFASP
jgi:serine/threonine-protein kinase